MIFSGYLAMTAAEIAFRSALPEKLGYMACHFSPYTTALSNMPSRLPRGSMLILNDRTPPAGHDPEAILHQLEESRQRIGWECLLLDFQRPDCRETAAIAKKLLELPCPVGISPEYAQGADCPVFLPPVPPDMSIEAYLEPWTGREVWLDVAMESTVIRVDTDGARSQPIGMPQEALPHFHPGLCCHYGIRLTQEEAVFTLHRSREDLEGLLERGAGLGVTKAVGLYQELGEDGNLKLEIEN